MHLDKSGLYGHLKLWPNMRLCKGGVQEAGRTPLHALVRIARGHCCHCVGVDDASLEQIILS